MDIHNRLSLWRWISLFALVFGIASSTMAVVAVVQIHALREAVNSNGDDVSTLQDTADVARQAISGLQDCLKKYDLSAPYTPGLSEQDVASITDFPLSKYLPDLSANEIADAVDANRDGLDAHVKLATMATTDLDNCVAQIKLPEEVGY